MKALFFLILLGLTSCKTAAPAPDKPAAPAAAGGPFEVAEEWISTPTGISAASKEVLASFSTPVVERMHAGPDGRYFALIADAGDAPEGILLELRRETDGWRVASEEIVPSDYLWPRH